MPVIKTIAVAGQSDIVAEALEDSLTIATGPGIVATTNATTDTLTISPLYGTTVGTICQGNDSRIGKFTSVLEYGAVGNDSTLNDTAFANAIAAHNGRLYFPGGVYRVAAPVAFNRSGLYFGDGSQTIIKTTSATANLIQVTGQASTIRDMTFQSSVTRSSGAYIVISAPEVRVSNFWMTGFLIGVQITAAAVAVITIEGGRLTAGAPSNGVAILVEDGLDITIRDISVDNASNIASGIRIKKCGDVTIEDCNIIHCIYGLEVSSQGSGNVIASVWGINSFFDNCGTHAGVFYVDTGGAIVRCTFTQCWFSSSGSSGVMILNGGGAGNIDGVDFVGCQFYLNSGDGITLNTTSAKNIRALSSSFAQNSGAGFSVAVAYTGRFSVAQCRLGNSHGFSGNGYGIYVTAGSSNYIITSNDMTGNTTSITDLGSAPKVVDNNL